MNRPPPRRRTIRPTVVMSLAKWRSLAGFTGDENEARTRILLTSATPGSHTLFKEESCFF